MNISKRLDLFPEYIFSRLSKQASKKEYIDELRSHTYPGYGAIPQMAEALQSWYRQRFQVQLKQNELYPLLGSRDGIAHCCRKSSPRWIRGYQYLCKKWAHTP